MADTDKRTQIASALQDLIDKGVSEDHPAIGHLQELLAQEQANQSQTTKPQSADFVSEVNNKLDQAAAEKAFGANESEPVSSSAMKANTSTDMGTVPKKSAEAAPDWAVEVGNMLAQAGAEQVFGANPKETESSTAMPASSSTKMEKPTGENTQATYADADIRDMHGKDFQKGVERVFGANMQEEAPSSAMKANVSTEVKANDDSKFATLFKATHGEKFDEKSKVDRAKMDQIKSMIQDKPELAKLAPNKFALNFYRQ